MNACDNVGIYGPTRTVCMAMGDGSRYRVVLLGYGTVRPCSLCACDYTRVAATTCTSIVATRRVMHPFYENLTSVSAFAFATNA